MPKEQKTKPSSKLYRDVYTNWNGILITLGILMIILLFLNSSVVYYFLLFVFIVTVICIILYYTFKLPPPSKIDTSSFFSSKVYGHRGCVNINDIDQGTLNAFKYAYNCGANGIECDIRLTKDRIPIIVHDYHMKNVTYYDLYDNKNNLPSMNFHELTLKEIKGLSLKYNAKVCQLTELVEFMNNHKYIKSYNKNKNKNGYFRLLLEFKHCNVNGYNNKDLENIMSIINKIENKNERIIFISFSVTIIYRLRRLFNDINIGLIFERHMWYTWIKRDCQIVNYKHLILYRFVDPIHTFLCQFILPFFCGCICIGIKYSLLSQFSIDHYHRHGLNIFCWGPHKKIDIQWLLSKGVCVVADDPKFAVQCAIDMVHQQ